MQRLRALVRRVRAEGFTPAEFRRICVAALAMLGAIVVTGAAVRLTDSGLGCEDWPNCNDRAFVDVSSKHAAVEQINRLFTFAVSAAVVLAALAAWYRRPRRADLWRLALAMALGVPAQGLVGAVVIWTHLHPLAVQLHFVLSMVLVGCAVVMLRRAGEADGRRRMNAVVPRTRRRVRVMVVWTALALLAGTVVTGTGPHAGDETARRFGWSITTVARVHSAVVWIAVASALWLLWHLRKRPHDREVLDAPLVGWGVLAAAQGAVGYIQYAAGVPAGLVLGHVTLATAMWAVAVWLWTATSRVAALSPA